MFLKDHKKTALYWKNESVSYHDLMIRVNGYARLFEDHPGENVALFSENRLEWTYAFYSVWQNRRVAVPIDYMSTADEVAYILDDCKPGVVFCSQGVKDTLDEALESLKEKPKVLVLDAIDIADQEAAVKEFPVPDVQDTAIIIYTSGTTGSPKGVMLSYDNILANIEAVSEMVNIYTPDRNVMLLLPLHHVFPLVGSMVTPLHVGGSVAFAPSLSAPDIMETLQKHKVAIIIGVPRFYNLIRKGIRDKIDASFATRMIFKVAGMVNSMSFSRKLFKKVHDKMGGHVRFMVTGGAKIDEDVARDYRTLGFEMLEGFGMTEAAPMITFTRPGRVKVGSAGEAMATLEVTTKDGEIIARGRNIMKGYYKKPEETAAVLKDGWLHTGDLGYFDDQGFVHVTGRQKELIILSNGKNISPGEIEKKIAYRSDIIAEIAVFAKDDSIQAAIFPDFRKVSDKGIQNLAETIRWDIIDSYNQKASPYKRISKFVIVKEELPKTRLGKIQRFKLPELTGRDDTPKTAAEEPDFEEYKVIKEFLKNQTESDVFPGDHFEIDMGLDSLDKVSFMTFLHTTFGVEPKEDLLINYPTLEKLSAYIREKKVKMSVTTVKWAEIFKEKVDFKLPKRIFTQGLFIGISRVFFKLYFRIKGRGQENVPQGPVIIAPNHQSFFDGLFVAAFIKGKIMKKTYFYAKEKHVRKRWLKFLANRNNIIVMDINRDLKLSLQKMAEVLKVGRNIIIFPEGTRSKDGSLGVFKKAFAILSRELNVPVVPVSIDGAYRAMPRGKKFPRPWKRIDVNFLEPVYPGDHTYDSLSNTVYDRIKGSLS